MKRLLVFVALLAVMALSVSAVFAQDGGPRDGERGQRGGAKGVGAVAEALEMEPNAILEAWQAGGTLADVITANGGDVDAITATLIANATERLNEAVAEGRIEQADADEKLAEMETRISELLNSTFEERPGREGLRGERGPRPPFDEAAPPADENGEAVFGGENA